MESLGIEFKLGNLDNKNNFEDVDIVFGSHVFEHLVEPSQFLSDLDLPNIKFVVLFIPNSKGLIFLFGRFLNKIRVSLLWIIKKFKFSALSLLFRKKLYKICRKK